MTILTKLLVLPLLCFFDISGRNLVHGPKKLHDALFDRLDTACAISLDPIIVLYDVTSIYYQPRFFTF